MTDEPIALSIASIEAYARAGAPSAHIQAAIRVFFGAKPMVDAKEHSGVLALDEETNQVTALEVKLAGRVSFTARNVRIEIPADAAPGLIADLALLRDVGFGTSRYSWTPARA